jgi:glutathione S-transferase
VSAQYVKLDINAYPAVARLTERCFAMPAFATSHPFEQPGYKASSKH